MIHNFSRFCEDVINKEVKKTNDDPSLLFTDVVGSSKMWQENPKLMSKMLDKMFTDIEEISNKYKGFIVKTIGDAFMIHFSGSESLKNAILAAIDIMKKTELKLRIGICKGEMIEKITNIQTYDLKDYFGETVNIASRMESKVSENDHISFTHLDELSEKQSEEIFDIINDYNPEKIVYSESCDDYGLNREKRSARLLSDMQINYCKSSEELKGVGELIAYTF